MKICLLAEAYYPFVGGAESHSKILAREFVRHGHQVVAITRRTRSDYPARSTIEGTKVYRVKPSGASRFGKYLMIPMACYALYRIRNDYDIIYVCGFRILGVIGIVMSKILQKTCILRAESEGEFNGEFIRTEKIKNSKILSIVVAQLISFRNYILKMGDGFISISSDITDEFTNCGVDKNKIKFIPNGVDVQYFQPVTDNQRQLIRKKLRLPSGWFIAYSGKLNRGKGLTILLEAIRILKSEISNIQLLLVGSGEGQYISYEKELREFVKEHSLDSNVTFTGYVKNVEEYLRASDCFVLPSRSEGLPLSLLEAMAVGLPSIGTKVGGIPYVIKDTYNGLLIKRGDVQILTQAIRKIYSNEQLSLKLGRNARKTILYKFSIKTIMNSHLKFFNSVISK